jgi:hypothetical protein
VLRQSTVQTARPATSQPPPSQRAKELNLNPPWWTPYAPPGSGYATLGEGAAATDAKESVAEAQGMGFADLAAADERGVNIDGDLRLGLKGLVSYKEIPRAGDLLVDPQERVDENGYRSTRFAGLDIRTGDVASRDRTFHRVARDPDGGERLVLRNGRGGDGREVARARRAAGVDRASVIASARLSTTRCSTL